MTNAEYNPYAEPQADHAFVEPAAVADDDLDQEPSRPARSSKRNTERALVRRVVSKYSELLNASAENLELLSTAIGAQNSPTELTIAVLTASRSDLASLTDTLALSEPTDPYDGMVAAISLGRVRIKGVWSVLSELGAVTGPVPVGDVKAGGAIAKAAGDLSQENRDEIAAVLALAKK